MPTRLVEEAGVPRAVLVGKALGEDVGGSAATHRPAGVGTLSVGVVEVQPFAEVVQ